MCYESRSGHDPYTRRVCILSTAVFEIMVPAYELNSWYVTLSCGIDHGEGEADSDGSGGDVGGVRKGVLVDWCDCVVSL